MRRDSGARFGDVVACGERMDLGQLPDDCAVATRTTGSQRRCIGNVPWNPRLAQWAPRTCANQCAAAKAGYRLADRPRNVDQISIHGGRDARVRSRLTTTPSRTSSNVCESGDPARTQQSREQMSKTHWNRADFASGGGFGAAERSPSLSEPGSPWRLSPAFRAKCSSVRAGRPRKRRFDHCREEGCDTLYPKAPRSRTTSVQAHAIAWFLTVGGQPKSI